MLLLLALHVVVAAALPALTHRVGSRALLLAAVPPAATVTVTAVALPGVLAGREPAERIAWVPGLGIDLALRMDPLAAALSLLVGVVGVVVALYGVRYFAGELPGRTAVGLVAFAGAMLGLVLADNLLVLYVFWELTTVCSFVLIGQDDTDAAARRSAVQALLVTTAGGLVMLFGFLLLAAEAGTSSISALVADPPTGPVVGVALVCVLVGAFAKSAQVPFHGWLPAAMIAPTPVSAYLHAAAMVNAGVYLIGRFAPAFADQPVWRPLVLTVGAATVLLGGWRALRQTDLKRLLAFSTVSQLGFLTILLGDGSRTAALAGIGLLLAHGMAKAALFLLAGAVEHETGTRDLRAISGLGRAAPALAVLAGLAAASLAGLPPLLGYVAKESAVEAFLPGGPGDLAVLAALLAGSALTVAYALRFVRGAFAGARSRPITVDGPAVRSGVEAGSGSRAGTPWALAGPVLPLVAGGVLLGTVPAPIDRLAAAWADRLPGAPDHHLQLWHGLTPALGLSLAALAAGALLHAARGRVARAQGAVHAALPRALDVDRGYRGLRAGLAHSAVAVTGRVQVGSPPVYLVVVAVTVLALPGTALVHWALTGEPVLRVQPWSSVAEAVLGGLVLAAAVALTLPRRRLAIVLVLGFVGYGVAGLFVLRGAPDLALTQVLVETLSLVAFVLVLRRIPEEALRPQSRRRQRIRQVVALGLGLFTGVLALLAAGARVANPVSGEIIARAEEEAGARNVVTAILVDVRALDTVAEASVLMVATVGVAGLVLVTRRTVRPSREQSRREVSRG